MIVISTLIRILRLRSDERTIRIRLIRTPHIAGTPHGHRMVVASTALSAHNVIPAVTLGQMRSLDAATIGGATPNTLRIANHMLGVRIIFHAADHTRLLIAFAGLPLQADNILLTIIVMQNGRIETGGSQIHRLAPRAFNILRLNMRHRKECDLPRNDSWILHRLH